MFTLELSEYRARAPCPGTKCEGCLRIKYRKIPKISPGAYIFQRPFLRSLSTEGNLHFKIDWDSLIVGRKFTVFALLYFVVESNCQVQAPGGAYIWRGDLREVFLRCEFGGAYIWRGLYMERLIFGILRYILSFTFFFSKEKVNKTLKKRAILDSNYLLKNSPFLHKRSKMNLFFFR